LIAESHLNGAKRGDNFHSITTIEAKHANEQLIGVEIVGVKVI
jgi:hypothetical protein